ncbi:MAG TPA: nucleoside transporter C-terminal domain-containing protein [Bacteroidales bacterium]|nr:nucleoside transporter C-terminal domain-containing protein [Bacteroidales bacterium]
MRKILYWLVSLMLLMPVGTVMASQTTSSSFKKLMESEWNMNPEGKMLAQVQRDTVQQQDLPSAPPVRQIAQSHGFRLVSLLRGLLGLVILVGLGFLLSTNRRAISWRVVLLGLLTQVIIAFLVLKVPAVQYFFELIGKVFIKILAFSRDGSAFLFRSMVTGNVEDSLITFAFQILPTIIFFSALTSILFYYGIIQKVVYALAWALTKLLKISGAESLSSVSNIFLGQTEAPLLIKEYLDRMNRSEIMLVMTGGMATMAGGVLAIYIGMLGGSDPYSQMLFAKHLISASVMAAPAGVVAAKLLVPQTEPIQEHVQVTRERIGSNILEAIANGTAQGLKLAVNVAAMLVVFIALIAMVNFILTKIGDWTSLNTAITSLTDGRYDHFSLQFILGYALSPIAWAIGVCKEDISLVAQLLGEKTILNEMIGYISLKEYVAANAFFEEKSMIIATYVLCGFANFSSIGIQIGGIGALAPNQRLNLSRLGLRALVGGTLAALFSATIIGAIMG